MAGTSSGPSGFLSATPDGLLVEQPAEALRALGIADIGGDGSIAVEAKTIDPRTKLAGAPKPEHGYQTIVQLGLFNELTEHRPQYAVISYADASYWREIHEFAVHFDPAIYANAKLRAAAALDRAAIARWFGVRKVAGLCSISITSSAIASRDGAFLDGFWLSTYCACHIPTLKECADEGTAG